MQDQVGIVGVGWSGFKPVVSDLSTRELMFEAASRAYRDAAIDPRRDVDAFVCCTEDLWEGWSITDEMVPDQIGAAQRPLCTIPADGVTGLGTAVMQLASGLAEVVVVEAHSKAADVVDKEAVERLAQEPSLVRPLGIGSDALAALEMGAFLERTGFKLDDCDAVVAAAMEAGRRNPRGTFARGSRRGPHRGSGAIASPLRLTDKAPFADAGVVLVLASGRWIKRNRKEEDATIKVDGIGWNTSLPWFDGGDPSTARYATDAFAQAARQTRRPARLADFDFLELDDTYSYKLLQHLLALSKDMAEARSILEGSGLALNPSGGALAAGNLIEASGLHAVLEAVLRLRSGAGKRKHNGAAARCLVQTWRGIPTATGGVVMLSSSRSKRT